MNIFLKEGVGLCGLLGFEDVFRRSTCTGTRDRIVSWYGTVGRKIEYIPR